MSASIRRVKGQTALRISLHNWWWWAQLRRQQQRTLSRQLLSAAAFRLRRPFTLWRRICLNSTQQLVDQVNLHAVGIPPPYTFLPVWHLISVPFLLTVVSQFLVVLCDMANPLFDCTLSFSWARG
jgi:hypothetical protein